MKPNFKSGVRFSENLMGCEMEKIKVVMSKPWQDSYVQVSLRL